jgi:outer membrane protein
MKVLHFLIFIVTLSNLQAQQIWSLNDCVDYALKNNLSLKQNELNIQQKEVRKMHSKMQLLPTINSNSSFNKNEGRYINPLTNDFVEEISTSLNLSLTTNITLLETAKNNLITTIALSYLQILFNDELYQTALKQFELTKNQENRIETLVLAGSVAKGELLNIQSQKALEEQRLTQAENQLSLSKLQLAQLLELKNHQNLEVLKLDIDIPRITIMEGIESDYEKALKIQSSIKSSELQVTSALYDLKIAKSNYAPNIVLGHRTSSVYADNAVGYSFEEQLRNNKQSGIYLNLNIPIFNQWAAHNAVNQSKIQIENNRLIAQQAKNELRKNMEQAHADQLAAYKRYQAATKSVLASKESYAYTTERYELGMVNSYEYNESKNKLISSESDKLQAKYDLIFKVKLYEFYTLQTFQL